MERKELFGLPPVETLVSPAVLMASKDVPSRLPKLVHPQRELFKPLSYFADGKPRINPSNLIAKTEAAMGGLPELKVDKNIGRQDSGVEVHRHRGETWWCLEGKAEFIIGGQMVDPKFNVGDNRKVNENEVRSKTVKGGVPYTVQAGDLLYIPEGVPHIHWSDTAAKFWFIKHPVAQRSPIKDKTWVLRGATPLEISGFKNEIYVTQEEFWDNTFLGKKSFPLGTPERHQNRREDSDVILDLQHGWTTMCLVGELEVEVGGRMGKHTQKNWDHPLYDFYNTAHIFDSHTMRGGVRATLKPHDILYIPEGHAFRTHTRPGKAAWTVTWKTLAEKPVAPTRVPGWDDTTNL